MRGAILAVITAGMVWGQGDGKLDKTPEYQEFLAERTAYAQVASLKAQVAALQARLDELKARYSDAHPDVRTAHWELTQAEAQLADAQKRVKESLSKGLITPQAGGDGIKLALPDLWWRNPATAQYLGLTAAQALKMDDVVAQHRPEVLAMATKLKAAERALDLLVSAEPLDEARTSGQIDAVAFLRSELEKTNGHMLLGIRKLLTPEQWTKLNQSFTLNLTKEPAR